MADLLELHQPGWTHRRFRHGRLHGASRIDRLYLAMSSAAFSLFVATAAVVGEVFDKGYPSDHLPVVARVAPARRRDPRILPPIDRRIFEAPAFFATLASRCIVSLCVSVAEAQDQLAAIKSCVRGLAFDHQFLPFVTGAPTARDRARLAVRAWRAWMCRSGWEVERCRGVWLERATRFEGGELRDQEEMRTWVSELSGAEAEEEEDRVRRGPEPEAQKAQASEKIRRRAAKWRLRSPRVQLRWMLGMDDMPLVDGPWIGTAAASFWGGVFEQDHGCVLTQMRRPGSWAQCRTSAARRTGTLAEALLGPRLRGLATRRLAQTDCRMRFGAGPTGCRMLYSRCCALWDGTSEVVARRSSGRTVPR